MPLRTVTPRQLKVEENKKALREQSSRGKERAAKRDPKEKARIQQERLLAVAADKLAKQTWKAMVQAVEANVAAHELAAKEAKREPLRHQIEARLRWHAAAEDAEYEEVIAAERAAREADERRKTEEAEAERKAKRESRGLKEREISKLTKPGSGDPKKARGAVCGPLSIPRPLAYGHRAADAQPCVAATAAAGSSHDRAPSARRQPWVRRRRHWPHARLTRQRRWRTRRTTW